MTDNERKFVIEIQGKTNQAIAEIRKLNKTVKTLEAEVNKSSKSLTSQNEKVKQASLGFKQLGAHLTRLAVIYGSLQTAGNLVRTMNELEQSLTGVSKTTGLSGAELKGLSEKLDELSIELNGIDISSLQDIAQSAGQLGVKGADNILLFTEQVAKISVAVNMSADETGSAFARLQNATGEPIEKMENLASAVNELSQSSTATVPEILHFSKNLASASTNAGITAQEVVALATTLRDVGATAEAGGTAISKLLVSIVTDSGKFAEAMGKDMTEFSKLVEDEPIKALQLFMEHYANLEKEAKGTFLEDLGLKSDEMSKAVGLVSGQFDKLTKHLNTSNQAYLENISIQKEFDIQSQTMQSTYIDLNNSFKLFSKQLMTDLIPAINTAMKNITDFINGLSKEQIQDFAESLGDLIKYLGELSIAVMEGGASAFNFVKDIKEATGVSGDFVLTLGVLIATMIKFRNSVIGLKSLVTIFTSLGKASPHLLALNVALGVTIGLYDRWETLKKNYNASLILHNDLIDENIGFLNISAEAYKNLGIESRKAFSSSLNANISNTKNAIKDLTEEIRLENAKLFTNDELLQVLTQRRKTLTQTLERMEAQQKKNLEIDVEQNKIDLEELETKKKLEAEENREIARKAELVKAQKELFEESKKTAESRLKTSESTVAQLYSAEKKLVADIAKLQDELLGIHKKHADNRVSIMQSYDTANHESLQKSKSETQQYHADIRRSAELHQKAVSALEKGNVDESKRLNEEVHALTMKWRGAEIKTIREKDVLNKATHKWEKQSITDIEVTADASRARTDGAMKQSLALALQISQAEEAEEIRLHNIKIDNKIAELEMVKTKISVELELMKNFKEIIEAVNNTQIDINFDVTEQNIKKIEDRISMLTNTKKPIRITADATQAHTEINSVVTKVNNIKPELKVLADLTPFQKEIIVANRIADGVKPEIAVEGDLTPYEIRVLQAKEITESTDTVMPVDANTEKAEKKVDTTKQNVQNIDKVIPKVDVDKDKADATIVRIADHVSSLALIEPVITVKIVSNVAEVKAEILALSQLRTSSIHTIRVDASAVWREKLKLEQTTYSTHIIRTVGGRAEGGLIERLATGGLSGEFTRKIGKIHGHDLSGSDDVPTMLTRGEYVSDVRTVDHYGADFFRMLKQRAIPRYASGGLVGLTSSGEGMKTSGRTVNLNLNIGGESYATMADEEIASALERVLRRGL